MRSTLRLAYGAIVSLCGKPIDLSRRHIKCRRRALRGCSWRRLARARISVLHMLQGRLKHRQIIPSFTAKGALTAQSPQHVPHQTIRFQPRSDKHERENLGARTQDTRTCAPCHACQPCLPSVAQCRSARPATMQRTGRSSSAPRTSARRPASAVSNELCARSTASHCQRTRGSGIGHRAAWASKTYTRVNSAHSGDESRQFAVRRGCIISSLQFQHGRRPVCGRNVAGLYK